MAYFIGGLAVVLVISVIVWFACAGRTSIHDLRDGADTVRNELDNARTTQQGQVDTLRQASEATDRSTEAVENSQRTTEEIKSIERTDRELIENCQRIIQRIRERGRTESKD